MRKNAKIMTQGALIAAVYVILNLLQNAIFPNSTSMAIQYRAAEALCVLAFFTPAAISGLSVGCLLFNLIGYGAVMPWDLLFGTLGSLFAAWSMYILRKVQICKIPVLGLLMPPVFNGLLVGLSLHITYGLAFWLNAAYVALGELAVMLTLGIALYWLFERYKLKRIL